MIFHCKHGHGHSSAAEARRCNERLDEPTMWTEPAPDTAYVVGMDPASTTSASSESFGGFSGGESGGAGGGGDVGGGDSGGGGGSD